MLSPVNASVSSEVVTVPALSVSAVILELLVTPAPSTLDRVMFKMFLAVVEAVALPVNIVPPIFEPVPSVEVATLRIGSSARASVVVALASMIGRVSFGPGGGAPLVTLVKSVLSVFDCEGATTADVVVDVENVDGSVPGGGVETMGEVEVAVCPDPDCPEPVEGVVVAVVVPVPVSIGGVVVAVEVAVSGIDATITLKIVGVALLPAVSLAAHVTVVVPTEKFEPGGGTHVAMPADSTSSDVAGGLYETMTPEVDVACALTSSCGAIMGDVLSATTTLNVIVGALLPALSVAEHVTTVVPTANVVPD